MAAEGRKYGFSGSITGAATKTIVVVSSGGTVRPYVVEFDISSNATPADNSSEWQLLSCTAAGTSTAVTPRQFDEQDPAAISAAGKNNSAEPTYTGVSLVDVAHNQRATFRWIAAPNGWIIAAATSGHGFGIQCQGVGGSGVTEIVGIVFGE